MKKSLLLWCASLLIHAVTFAQMSREQIISSAQKALPGSIEQLNAFLSLPNNGRVPSDRQLNVDWCLREFQEMGFATEVLLSDGIPHVLATKTYGKALKTVLFYMQIDGQPVDPTEWHQPDPYIPVVKEEQGGDWHIIRPDLKAEIDPDWRIFARSASDSKGPAMALITALRILQEQKKKPAYNIKVIMDFQEEMGSPTLPKLVEAKREVFAADMMLIMDGTRHLSNLPTLTFGARGIATISLKVYGARDNLHSGQYGNFAPNPVFGLSRLLAGMKDEQGRVLIPGYYEGVVLTDTDRLAIAAMPEDMDEIMHTLGIAEAEQVGPNYGEALQYPSLNVRGIKAAWVGDEVRTLVPAEAIAEIDMRLVPETPAERMIGLVRTYIEQQGYHIIEGEPTEQERMTYPKLISFSYRIGSRPFRTDLDSDIGRWLGSAMQHVFDDQFVKMRTTGGSQPIAPFITTLDIPAVSIRIPNPDNSIHAPNENIRIGNYLEGILMCLSILTQPFK